MCGKRLDVLKSTRRDTNWFGHPEKGFSSKFYMSEIGGCGSKATYARNYIGLGNGFGRALDQDRYETTTKL